MPKRRIHRLCLLAWMLVPLPLISLAQEKSVQPGINKTFEDPGLDVVQWTERFEKEGREIYDHRQQIVAACQLRPGLDVADVGAGSGLFTRLFAEKVGPDGQVFAVDIAEKFLHAIRQASAAAGLKNIATVLGAVDDTRLPPASVDVVFLCDTYHHFEFPQKSLASIHRALRPGGRLVIVDFKRIEGVSSEWILKHVRAGQEVVTQEIEASGFRLIDTQDFLQENYLLRFERQAAAGESESSRPASAWKPVEGQLLTRWARQVTPDKAWEAYPRPQLVRPLWTNLNGLWDYAIRPKDEEAPQAYDGKILVPFPVESALSGVKKPVTPEQRLWYHRTFELPNAAQGQRWLLHFGAVDWHAQVWVNGRHVGEHRGGYDSFTFDVTDALQGSGSQQLTVSVWDPTDTGYQPRGKQVLEPRGIWYTAVTGIWQTVWLEPVPEAHLRSLRLTPDVDRGELQIAADVAGMLPGLELAAEATMAGKRVSAATSATGQLVLKIPQARLWSPEDPFLYGLTLSLRRNAEVVDRVDSYFGMRKIEMGKAEDGFNRLLLNGRPLFQFGPLDQGWWPDGLYTAPNDEALRSDVEITKRLGFNMIRKHVKVEPARWYYHCDQLGLLVWQDMPNGDKHIRGEDPDLVRSPESADNFRREYQALIDQHRNYPCVVVWVPFNEGWGQFDTNKVLAWTKQYDPTRLVDAPSGWTDRGEGDMRDLHSYPGPDMPPPEEHRAAVLGEFGGLGLPVAGHLWWDKRNWGYRTYQTREELQQQYESLIRKLRPLISRGLAAAVYTQTTDVEGEVNGLLTYDREVIKYDVERLAGLHARLYLPPPRFVRRTVLATSEQEPQRWRYTLQPPADGWQQPPFDDSAWQEGPGGFGSEGTPGAVVRTAWKTSDIWLRRQFELADLNAPGLHLRVHHDEDAEVFINGQRVAALNGYTRSYEEIELEPAPGVLRQGTNTLAVHCRQTQGGQYIDVGLVSVEEQ